ncbi:MAG: double-strand break repair protein AddB [Alphaproteobacteria bacterium]
MLLTTPPTAPFLPTVAAWLLAQHAANPFSLAQATIFVPAPRQVNALRAALVAAAGDDVVMLPTILPLSVTADHPLLATIEQPAECSPLSRHLLLTRLIQARDAGLSTAQAYAQAVSLGGVLDELTRYRIPPARVLDIVPSTFAEHWRLQTDFLKLVLDIYPAWLAEQNMVDSTAAAQHRLHQLAAALRQHPPHALYAVGFADTTPAGAEVLAAIATHPQGTLIFPALDKTMPEADWHTLPPSHPQFGFVELLATLGLTRAQVGEIAEAVKLNSVSPDLIGGHGRANSGAREGSSEIPDQVGENRVESQACAQPVQRYSQHLTLLTTPNAETEAAVVSAAIRQVLEEEGTTIALITPDRALASKVASHMALWGVPTDDSAGEPLATTPMGSYVLSLLHAAATNVAPLAVAALLKHPLAACPPAHMLALENTVLRGVHSASGLRGLRLRWQEAKNPDAAMALDHLASLLQPLTALGKSFTPEQLVTALNTSLAATNILCLPSESWDPLTLEDTIKAQLAEVLENFAATSAFAPVLGATAAHHILVQLLTATATRPLINNARVFIWGPLEARMQTADVLVLASLNEGIFPPTPTPCPWLHRAAREQLRLPQAERALGLAAQDVRAWLHHPRLILSRATTLGAEATLPSRFLTQHLFTVDKATVDAATARGAQLLAWVEQAARVGLTMPSAPAVATPPVSARPTSISASQLKNLLTCPYKTFAQKVLGLQEADDWDAAPDAADRGQLLHTLLQGFFVQVEGLPAPFGKLTNENISAAHTWFTAAIVALCQPLPQAVQAVWQPRAERLIPSLLNALLAMHDNGDVPMQFEETLRANVGQLTFTAKADRVDNTVNGAVAVDYKTGTPPSLAHIANGQEPQLGLELWLLHHAGKTPHAATTWHLPIGGSGEVEVSAHTLADMEEKTPDFLLTMRTTLENIAAYYGAETNGYAAIPSEKNCQYCTFSGLCRKGEWHHG